jgi:hypothetical protein
MPVTVIQEKPRAGPNAVDQEVECAVPVHIRKRGPRREIAGKIQAGRGGYIREPPPPKVFEERHMPFKGAHKNVAQTVPVNISQGHARSIEADLVIRGVLVTQSVGELDARFSRIHQREAGMALRWNPQRNTAIPDCLALRYRAGSDQER